MNFVFSMVQNSHRISFTQTLPSQPPKSDLDSDHLFTKYGRLSQSKSIFLTYFGKKKKFKHAQDSIKMHMDWLYDKESIKMIKDKQQQNAILSVAFK